MAKKSYVVCGLEIVELSDSAILSSGGTVVDGDGVKWPEDWSEVNGNG